MGLSIKRQFYILYALPKIEFCSTVYMTTLQYGLPLILVLILIACGEDRDGDTQPVGRVLDYNTSVTFLTSSGDVVSTLDVAVADDNASRSAGLMDVFDMPSDKGMLFIFDNEEPRSFWMANTPLALDIIFVNADMEIIRIHQNTRPYSDRNVQSELPAQYVVETNAGYTLRHDIIEGMKMTFELNNDG